MARGEYGLIVGGAARGDYRRAIVGTIYHSVSDRDAATEQINTEFRVFVADFMHAIGVNPAELDLVFDPKFPTDHVKQARFQVARGLLMASPFFSLWRDVISPVYDEWQRFYQKQTAFTEFMSSYDDYERWMSRLQQLRDAVGLANIKLHSPTPIALPRTVWEQAGNIAANTVTTVTDGATGIAKLLRVAVIGALVVGGAVAIGAVVHDVKGNRSPTDRYGRYAKGLARVAG